MIETLEQCYTGNVCFTTLGFVGYSFVIGVVCSTIISLLSYKIRH